MDWSQFFEDGIKPVDLFFSKLPPLSGIRMMGIILDENGPSISLRFNLSTYPDKPPKKWIEGQFNQAQLTFTSFSVIDLEIKGWGLDNVGDMTIEKEGADIILRFISPNASIKLVCDSIVIEKLSGYCRSYV